MSIQEQIKKDVEGNRVMLFIKGEKGAPQCGFSATVLNIFEQLGVPFETRNVLADAALRDGIKQYTNWPTIPQIFINGEFVGGCDIAMEMYRSGELKKMLADA